MSANDVALAYRMAFEPTLFHKKGHYVCTKSGMVQTGNAYVHVLCFRFDGERDVQKFSVGNVKFPYFHPEDCEEETGCFDFDLRLKDGRRKLLLVVPQIRVCTPVGEALIEAAESQAKSLGAAFELWTEPEIFGPNPNYMLSLIPYLCDRGWEKFKDEADDFEIEEEVVAVRKNDEPVQILERPKPKWGRTASGIHVRIG